jgi:hypothetical protein
MRKEYCPPPSHEEHEATEVFIEIPALATARAMPAPTKIATAHDRLSFGSLSS